MSDQRQGERITHWLRHNKAEAYPRRYVVLDSEARIAKTGSVERHTFRLAHAISYVVDRDTQTVQRRSHHQAATPADLWEWIAGETRHGERSWLFAHNLGYDLRVCQAFSELRRLGWTLREWNLEAYRVWCRWAKGSRSIVMVDTASFVPASLDAVARELGWRRPVLPGPDAPDSAWAYRCMVDTELLADVVYRLLDWLRAEHSGSLRFTGAAQAMAHYRHRYLGTSSILVHTVDQALSAERDAAWTGRCEVWRWGKLKGPLVEWDYQLAYARLGRDTLLPARLVGDLRRPSLKSAMALPRRYRWLARCQVDTEVPVLPARAGESILWPSGRFSGWYWDSEVRLAVGEGARVDVDRVIYYQAEPLLAEWGRWIVAYLEHPPPDADPVVMRMVKGWSRSLIGRFGMRVDEWERFGRMDRESMEWLPVRYVDQEADEVLVQVGQDVHRRSGRREAGSSAPQVMSAVMADMRCQLWRTMLVAGLDHVAYIDTDSLLVDAVGDRRLAEWTRSGEGEGLRVKARYRAAELRAPRQITVGGRPRIAGLSHQATRVSRDRWESEVWEGMAEGLRNGRADSVQVWRRPFTVRGVDHRRRHVRGGHTVPFVAV